MLMMSEGEKSYWSWAYALSRIAGTSVSKQAIFNRMNHAWVKTVKALLQQVLQEQFRAKVDKKLFKHFNQVWIQDSTNLHLPEALTKKFKGNTSYGKQKSVAKLNVVMNAVSGVFAIMDWSSFTVNEQRLSRSILQIARRGDLVIRDLGYFVLDVFSELNASGIYFLSRWKYGVNIYCPNTHKELDLHKLIKGKQWLDCEVLCGRTQKLRMRLIAVKLSDQQASERRRKAKNNRDYRLNHNKTYYRLLDYIILITNVEVNKWGHNELVKAYRLRWAIETMFKSWKSGFKMQQIIPDAKTNLHRIESVLYLLLLYIVWFQMLVYTPLRWKQGTGQNYVSINRLAKLIKARAINWLTESIAGKLKPDIAYYCSYEKRRNRLNNEQALAMFLIP